MKDNYSLTGGMLQLNDTTMMRVVQYYLDNYLLSDAADAYVARIDAVKIDDYTTVFNVMLTTEKDGKP